MSSTMSISSNEHGLREVRIERDRTFFDFIFCRKAKVEIYETRYMNDYSFWCDKKTGKIISDNKALEVISIYYHTNREDWCGDNP